MTDWDGKTFWAAYDRFSVGPESGNYKLSVGDYNRGSTVPDMMAYHNGMMFSTYDRDNDKNSGECARSWKGGWWYNNCFDAKPTGVYLPGGVCDTTGIVWGSPSVCWGYSHKRMTLTLIPQ